MRWRRVAPALILGAFVACHERAVESPAEPPAEPPVRLRIALFNVRELSTAKITDVDADGVGQNEQLRAATAIIQAVQPDVLVLNEIDHDYDALDEGLEANARRFAAAYLEHGESPVRFEHAWAGPNNTGILSGVDLDGNGLAATDADRGDRRHGDDAYGYGVYPGQYSMALLSSFPIRVEAVRSFQRLLWRDLPGHHIPDGFYSDEALDVLRLSSKSHQDVPIDVEGRDLHLLLSHPTPPVFDGDEDRNGRRNFDEIKLWAHYLDGDERLVDDAGRAGGLEPGERFVLLGDLNARPDDEAVYDGRTAISQLLEHPRVQDDPAFARIPARQVGRAGRMIQIVGDRRAFG